MTGSKVAGGRGIISDDLLGISLDALEQGITIFDADLNLVFANRKFLELRDLPPELGNPGTRFEDQVRFRAERGDYGAGDVGRLVQEHVELARQFQLHRIERTRHDGTVLEIRGDPLPVGGFIATYTDITEQKNSKEALRAAYSHLELSRSSYEKQGEQLAMMVEELSQAKKDLESANRTKTEFLANMSHELRTPLNAIIGFSEIIGGEVLGPTGTKAYREYAHDICNSGKHLLDIINDILDMSKIESGVDELNEQEVALHEIIQSVIPMIRGRADSANLVIKYDLEPSSPLVTVDCRKLKQALLNLLANAVKFTPDGGTIVLRAWSNRTDGVVMQVVDDGIGIALQDIPKALSPFQQVHGELSREHEGTGLGLPLTKALIEQHGGSLDLQSKLGEGTTVTIRLPAERLKFVAPRPAKARFA